MLLVLSVVGEGEKKGEEKKEKSEKEIRGGKKQIKKLK